MRFSPSIVIALVTLNSVSAFSPNGMRIAPALVSTPTRSDRSHAVSRVEKPYGISTISSFSSSSSSSLNSVFTREDDAETPELDGGETPTEDEIRRIKSIRDNEFVPEEEGLMTKAFSRMKLFSQKRREEDETNDELFGVLKSLIIGGSYKFNSVDLEDEITFTSSTREILWGFEIKKNIKNRLQIAVAYPVLKNAPALKTDIDTELMTQKDYDDLSEGFVDPHEAQMKVENPEQCFLKNAPAFCKPQDDGTSVCNLNYLATYQVRKGTVRRYGGLAVVKDGKIIEVSGVKESDGEAFELEKAVFFNSFAVHVVLVRHAVMGHLALYQKNLMKVTANRSDGYEELWKKHLGPELLMKALTPSATNDVNTNIQLLIGPPAIGSQACAVPRLLRLWL